MTAAANIQRRARRRGKAAIDRWETVIFFPVWIGGFMRHQVVREGLPFHGSSLPIRFRSAISPPFIARLIKGCRVDVCAGIFVWRKPEHFQRSNEHFSRESAALGAFFLRP
jgi:hypothetical protein